jgi:hypothetical protein
MMPLQHKVEQALRRAGGTHSVEDVVAAIHDRRAFPWYNRDGLIIAELVRYPQHQEVNCWVVAGKLEDCLEILPEVEGWGRRVGARYICGSGRPGFRRVLGNLKGWQQRSVVMCKELSDG